MTDQATDSIIPFAVKDCALAAIATGVQAMTLGELVDNLKEIHSGSIYYHFWGGLLRPRFDDREYNNDFAIWTSSSHGLHDEVLAERLAVIDPTEYGDMEDLRRELIDLMETRLDESERLVLQHADEPFSFIRSQIVVFNTRNIFEHPPQLAEALPHLSAGSIYYHFIDARRRTPEKVDDFRNWLKGCTERYEGLCEMLAGVDPYFSSLTGIRDRLTYIFKEYFGEK